MGGLVRIGGCGGMLYAYLYHEQVIAFSVAFLGGGVVGCEGMLT